MRRRRELFVRLRRSCLTIFCTLVLASPADVRADNIPGQERIDFTAYTLRRNEAQFGVGSLAFGVLEPLTIGTYVLPWFAFPFLHSPVATGFVKVRDWFSGPVAVSVRGTFIYLNATEISADLWNISTRARLFILPIELSGSFRIHTKISESLQFTWVYVGLAGKMPQGADRAALGGSSRATSTSLSSFTEFRLTQVTALTLRATVLLTYSDIVARANYENDGTRLNARLSAEPDTSRFAGNVVPGIAFSWAHVNLQLGVGFGTNWLPVAMLPTKLTTIVPDFDFYVRF
jgi:hypothetical protein